MSEDTEGTHQFSISIPADEAKAAVERQKRWHFKKFSHYVQALVRADIHSKAPPPERAHVPPVEPPTVSGVSAKAIKMAQAKAGDIAHEMLESEGDPKLARGRRKRRSQG